MPKRNRYYVHDRDKGMAPGVADYGPGSERFMIIDRETGRYVDEAATRYEARSAAQGWNQGAYGEPEQEGGE